MSSSISFHLVRCLRNFSPILSVKEIEETLLENHLVQNFDGDHFYQWRVLLKKVLDRLPYLDKIALLTTSIESLPLILLPPDEQRFSSETRSTTARSAITTTTSMLYKSEIGPDINR